MKMKYLIIGCLTFFSGMVANAEDMYLHIRTNNGDWKMFSIENVDKLQFSDSEMKLISKNGAESESFPLTSLSDMTVDDKNLSGVECIRSVEADDSFSIDGNVISVLAGEGAFMIFDMNGTLCGKIDMVREGENIDLSGINKGMYVVKYGEISKKINLK